MLTPADLTELFLWGVGAGLVGAVLLWTLLGAVGMAVAFGAGLGLAVGIELWARARA